MRTCHLALEAATLIFSVSSHTSAFPASPSSFHSAILASPFHALFPLSHLYLFPTISHSSLSYPTVSHQREGELSKRERERKLLMLSFGAQPVKLALNARTQQHTLV